MPRGSWVALSRLNGRRSSRSRQFGAFSRWDPGNRPGGPRSERSPRYRPPRQSATQNRLRRRNYCAAQMTTRPAPRSSRPPGPPTVSGTPSLSRARCWCHRATGVALVAPLQSAGRSRCDRPTPASRRSPAARSYRPRSPGRTPSPWHDRDAIPQLPLTPLVEAPMHHHRFGRESSQEMTGRVAHLCCRRTSYLSKSR